MNVHSGRLSQSPVARGEVRCTQRATRYAAPMVIRPARHNSVLRTSLGLRTAVSRDAGGMIRRTPAAVATPRTADGVRTAVSAAAAANLHVVVRGGGFGLHGAALTEGCVIDLSGIDDIAGIDGGAESVDAGAGVTWGALLAYTLQCGRIPRVVPDALGLCVGGVVRAGGYGEASAVHGRVMDSAHVVESVDLAETGAGNAVVATRVCVPLVEAGEAPTVTTLHSQDPIELMAAVASAADRIDGATVDCVRHGGVWRARASLRHSPDQRIDASRATTARPSWHEYLDAAAPLVGMLATTVNPWLSIVAPAAVVPDLIGVLSESDPVLMGRAGRVILRPVDGGVWLVDVIRVMAQGDTARVDAAIADNCLLSQFAQAHGCTLYAAASVLCRPGAEAWA